MRVIHQFAPGDVFNKRYELQNLIGTGGFAEVWKAYDRITKQVIAIKIYANLDDEGRRQLTEEYSRLQALSHPNIVKAEHFDIYDNLPYLIMRYCAGGSLEQQIGRMSATDMMWVVKDIMSALNYLHANNIVHQDIKPANILIDISGNRPCYLLCDFGISGRTRTSLERSVSDLNSKSLFMTTFYAPPEKFSSKKSEQQPYPGGDIFSLGVTMLELTGTLVNEEKSLGAELMNNSQITVNYNVLPSEPLRVMVGKMLMFDRHLRGTAKLYYDWAENVLDKMSVDEHHEVTHIQEFGRRQATKLEIVEEERLQVGPRPVKVDVNTGEPKEEKQEEQILGELVEPEITVPPVKEPVDEPAEDDDDVLELLDDDEEEEEVTVTPPPVPEVKSAEPVAAQPNRNSGAVPFSNDKPRTPEKLVIAQDDDADDEPGSWIDNNKPHQPEPVAVATDWDNESSPVSGGGSGKSNQWLAALIAFVLVGGAIVGGYFIYKHLSPDTQSTEQEEDIIIQGSDSDIAKISKGVNRIENRFKTFKKTKFFNESDFMNQYNSISTEVQKLQSDCNTVLNSSNLPGFQESGVNELKSRLEELNNELAHFYFVAGAVPGTSASDAALIN